MKKIIKYIFSMEVAGILILLLAFSMGMATFIENDFGVASSKSMVYNSLWFELLSGLLFVNLFYNSIKIKPWKTGKWSVFAFHISFLVIILGAAATRFIGYEGTMNIREGESSSFFLSTETYLKITNLDGEVLAKKEVLFSSISNNKCRLNFELNKKNYTLETYQFNEKAIYFTIKNKNKETIIDDYAIGGSGFSLPNEIDIEGVSLIVNFGSEIVNLPFFLKLRDFQLERYPATNSSSSYASEVTLIDKEANVEMDYRIYMNNVLDYKGYRFFQSSYDEDEKGTVLSVNHDYLGMIITYLGYGLMIIAMFLALFDPKSRFKVLMRKNAKMAKVILVFLLITPLFSIGQNATKPIVDQLPQAQIDSLNMLLVQGHSGRFQPYNSISSQIVRKFSRKLSYKGVSSDRMLLGIMMNPEYWAKQELIKVSNDDLKELIGNDNPRAAFVDFFQSTPQGNQYKLGKYVDEAYRKKPSERGKFDKDLITVDERVNVFYMALNKEFMRIFPVPNKENENWRTPADFFIGFPKEDSAFAAEVFNYYLISLQEGIETGDYTDAQLMLRGIQQFQNNNSPNQLANLAKMQKEITYNKVNIFDRLFAPYGLIGFIMLVLLFIKVLWPKYKMKWTIRIFAFVIFLSFIAHTLGLVARWYIAGHAPWSNGYESMIFIGWATILAGLFFYKNSPIALAATSVLASLIMYVAHLSWMNPEITNLVPVLKSYWLTIHVAIITASYGFLIMGAFMGFLNLLFSIPQNKENHIRISEKIAEITRINEMTLIAGIYLLTIGTFLGGIWANESWGRYWGWDPKETWALVTILVYAFILHMRFIPGLKSKYAFNLLSIIGYFSVLMTYFGVNYYLSGLHSYASGDPMPIPNFVYYALATIVLVAAMAYYKDKKFGSGKL
ncbi:MAG: c-type cytochrome biogenesis protein CcsB [Bacteroidetes bacterium 4572_77]|nr:MAG: c-type cytochrome biogenesis protein CcsB [Bacteroidetes bacterium 4572_77]